eukprot:1732606-Amphidinium_carterae.2
METRTFNGPYVTGDTDYDARSAAKRAPADETIADRTVRLVRIHKETLERKNSSQEQFGESYLPYSSGRTQDLQ